MAIKRFDGGGTLTGAYILAQQGVGLGFGSDITRRFLEDNGLTGVIRSHEVRQAGYSIEHGGQCITVFSAPNYVGLAVNLTAFYNID